MLAPLGWVYGAGVLLRNVAYDLHLLPSFTPAVPVIAVGNLTAGGTGKTPLVGWIVQYLLSQGARPAIISRGYGRQSRGVLVVSDGTSVFLEADKGGDEPVQLARAFPGVPVIVGERRTAAAEVALERFHAEMLVLDDAFQHRAIGRHVNILVVDATMDLTQEPLLPAGRRREQLSSMRRASVVVFTHARAGAGPVPWEYRLRNWYDGEIVYSERRISAVRTAAGDVRDVASYEGKRCLLLSGIGKPDQFERDVLALGAGAAGHMRYSDHHWYTGNDIAAIVAEVKRTKAEVLLTTEKDLTRLSALPDALTTLGAAVDVAAAVLSVHPLPAGRLEALLDACRGQSA